MSKSQLQPRAPFAGGAPQPVGVGQAPLKRNVAQGALWILAEVCSAEVINLVSFIVLSRILTPADYGVAAIAGVISALLQLALTRGLVDAVVGRREVDEDTMSTAFWANMLVAGALFLLVQMVAPLLAWCFGHPLVAPMLQWFSLCFFTTAVTAVPLAVLRRTWRYKAYAVRAAIGAAIGGALGVAMALAGFGIWSFVGAQVGQGAASAITVWAASEWRPRLRLSGRALRDLVPFSVQTVAGAMLDFMATRVDVLAVGLALDPTSLGYYYLLKRLLQTATSATLYPAFSLMMPTLRRLVGDPPRFNKAYVSLVSVAHASWVFVATGFLACSPDVLPAVFGSRWIGAVPLLQSASVLGIAFAVGFCTSQALGAVGQARAYLSLAVIQVALTGLLVGVAAQFNVVATGAALGVSFIVSLPLNLRALGRHISLDPFELVGPCVRIALAGGSTAAVVLLLRVMLTANFPHTSLPDLAAFDVALCGLVYVGALRIIAPGVYRAVVDLARSVLSKPRMADAT